MANNTITIRGKKVVEASTATELELDRLDSTPKVVTVINKVCILPGEQLTTFIPEGICRNGLVALEPFNKKEPFF